MNIGDHFFNSSVTQLHFISISIVSSGTPPFILLILVLASLASPSLWCIIQRGALALSFYLLSPALYFFLRLDNTAMQTVCCFDASQWQSILNTSYIQKGHDAFELCSCRLCQWSLYKLGFLNSRCQWGLSKNQRTDVEWRKYTGLVVTNLSSSTLVIFITFSHVYFNVLFWTIFQFCTSYILRMTSYVRCWFSISFLIF